METSARLGGLNPPGGSIAKALMASWGISECSSMIVLPVFASRLFGGHICPIIMGMKSKDAIRRFKKAGVTVSTGRGKGGDVMLFHGDRFTTLTTSTKDLGPVYLRKVCKSLAIKYEDVF